MDTIIALLSLKDIGLREIGIQLMIAATAQEKVPYLSTTILYTLDTICISIHMTILALDWYLYFSFRFALNLT